MRINGSVSLAMLSLCSLLSLSVSQAQADDSANETANKAFAAFKAKCYHCHGGAKKIESMDILDRKALFANRGESTYIARGDLDKSLIWNRIDDGSMPPDEDEAGNAMEPLTDDEKQSIQSWIEQGAPLPVNEVKREFISNKQVLQWIDDDTRNFKFDKDFAQVKYFSLVHLHNNPEVSDFEIRLHRAALSKALNSLSTSSSIDLPVAIDENETVFRIMLDDYGWTQEKWDTMLEKYPYGHLPNARDPERDIFDRIDRTLGANFDRMYPIRADWFIARATRPELYHMFLDIPEKVADLESRLGVDRANDLKKGNLIRGGVLVSRISSQNRVVDRHEANNGSYWISYDFAKEAGKANIAVRPLGPDHDDPALDLFEFQHDGGEIIFHLNNGLQGYMLITNEGDRIDVGPTSIVADVAKASGTTEIINGLSCMSCHKNGTKEFKDVIHFAHGVENAAAVKMIDTIYDQDEMQKWLADDQEDHLKLLKRTMGPFLQVAEDEDKKIDEFPEPITYVAHMYDQYMTVAEVAAELGFDDKLRVNLRDPDLIQLGLGLLDPRFQDKEGDIVYKRAMWDTIVDGESVFQKALIELGLGIPTSQ